MEKIVGAYVKRIRRNRGITLQQLADHTGLSAGFISLLERGMTSPTVSNLHKICEALSVSMADMFADIDDGGRYVARDSRRVFYEEINSIRYESVLEGRRQLTGFCMTVFDDSTHESAPHVADECGYVLSGSMDITVSGETYSLAVGDTIYVCAGDTHSYRRTSDEPCVSVWFGPSSVSVELQERHAHSETS